MKRSRQPKGGPEGHAPSPLPNPATPDPGDTMVSTSWVAATLGVTRRAVVAWADSGLLPPPYRLGPRTLRWRRSVILAWLESRQGVADAV